MSAPSSILKFCFFRVFGDWGFVNGKLTVSVLVCLMVLYGFCGALLINFWDWKVFMYVAWLDEVIIVRFWS